MVPEVKAISAGTGGVRGDGARHRIVGQEVVERAADQADDRHVRAQVGLERHPAEFGGGDEDLRPGRRHDVAEFPATVEVHDRHGHRAKECRGPERRGGLHPVRQLDGHDIARADAARPQTRRQPAGLDLDVGEGAGERPHRGMHMEGRSRVGRQPAGHQIPERLLRPPPFGYIAFGQVLRDVSHVPLLFAQAAHR